jgi:hypothetical protein
MSRISLACFNPFFSHFSVDVGISLVNLNSRRYLLTLTRSGSCLALLIPIPQFSLLPSFSLTSASIIILFSHPLHLRLQFP